MTYADKDTLINELQKNFKEYIGLDIGKAVVWNIAVVFILTMIDLTIRHGKLRLPYYFTLEIYRKKVQKVLKPYLKFRPSKNIKEAVLTNGDLFSRYKNMEE